jgi:prepilin-type N-terminal cleavage/methylation domain-containing protein/prepilin-type processing-associated H-X9-DG protein
MSGRSYKAFTLVELLVVLAIISVLIAILLPALSRVREQARSVACLSNLRQIGIGMLGYSADHRGVVMPAGFRLNYSPNQNVSDSYANILVDGRYVPAPQIQASDAATQGSVFRCPSGNDMLLWNYGTLPLSRTDELGARPWRAVSQSSGRVVDTWYGINAVTNADPTYQPDWRNWASRSVPLADGSAAGLIKLQRLGSVRAGSQRVWLFDGVFMNVAINLQGAAFRVNARHMRRTQTNILFMDGHCSAVSVRRLPVDRATFASPTKLNLLDGELVWRADQR